MTALSVTAALLSTVGLAVAATSIGTDIITTGIIRNGANATGINTAGSFGFGESASSAAIYFNGANLELDVASGGFDFSFAGTPEAVIDTDGIDLVTGDAYEINGTDVLTADTLGSGVLASSLTSVGTLASLTIGDTLTVNGSAFVIDASGNVTAGGTKTLFSTGKTLYVSTTGSDSTGDGSEGNPYATVNKAHQQIPYHIDDIYIIKIANGTYTETIDTIDHTYSSAGQLTLDGYEGVTQYAGEFTSTSFAFLPEYGGATITVAGSGWSVDDFYGKFLRVTSGVDVGTVIPIYKNTADTITVPPEVVAALSKGKKDDGMITIRVAVPMEHELAVREYFGGSSTPKSLGVSILKRIGIG